MLDIKWIRENPDDLDRALRSRGARPEAARLIALDEARRTAIGKLEEAQARRNAASKEIGKAKAAKDEATAAKLMGEVADLKSVMQALEEDVRKADKALDDTLAVIPNIPLEDVPVGPDEHANVEYRRWGTKPGISNAKEHFDIGEALGGMDFETAAKLSGSRFVVLKGQVARMERALGQFMLDLHTTEHGYTEVQPPLLVSDATMFGTAQLPKFRDDQFAASRIALGNERLVQAVTAAMIARYDTSSPPDPLHGVSLDEVRAQLEQTELRSDFWLIPTAEVPLTNLVRESVREEKELPIRVTALTPCFRSEAGAAGKDTRGMLRQHQFDKVELVSITTPEQSRDEHERMLVCAEEVLKRLDIHYRVMTLSTGDMGFAAQKTYDIEVWLPGQETYREISSCSGCGDFQARRMQARYKPKDGKGNRLVHTLNGSGVAVGRALIAVLENYQNEDGSVTVPDALRPQALYGRGATNHSLFAIEIMRILITNDDGIHAGGLTALEKIASQLSDDVWVVAPETDQSGLSHSLSLNDPLRLREIGERRFALRGTPSDCVIMAVRRLLGGGKADLLLSGVNAGQNVADDVTYSGTIAGAIEGTLLGISSIALSQAYSYDGGARVVPWETAETHGPGLIRKLIEFGFPEGIVYNVNFPNRKPGDVMGMRVTGQGKLTHGLHIDERIDGRGNQYFWLAYRREKPLIAPGTDVDALASGAISVTPLRLDMTAYDLSDPLRHHLARGE